MSGLLAVVWTPLQTNGKRSVLWQAVLQASSGAERGWCNNYPGQTSKPGKESQDKKAMEHTYTASAAAMLRRVMTTTDICACTTDSSEELQCSQGFICSKTQSSDASEDVSHLEMV